MDGKALHALMSLQCIPPGQKIPGAIVTDLREYAVSLKLPSGWEKKITLHKEEGFHGVVGTKWFVNYNGSPLAIYELDILDEIADAKRHWPIPPPVDPLVVATELALMQPSDTRFRRFNDCLFRVDAVEAIDGKLIKEGKPMMRVIMNSGKEYVCGNEPNYANSGMSTFEFFLQHVMNLAPDNANRIGHR